MYAVHNPLSIVTLTVVATLDTISRLHNAHDSHNAFHGTRMMRLTACKTYLLSEH